MLSLAFVVIAMAYIAWGIRAFKLSTDIAAFLPGGRSSQNARLQQALAKSPLSRSFTLALKHSDRETAVAAAIALRKALRAHPEVAWMNDAVDDTKLETAVRELYLNRTFELLHDGDDRQLRQLLTPDGIAERIDALKEKLASSSGGFFRGLATHDPLMAFGMQLERLIAMRSGTLDASDGVLIASDGTVVLLGRSKHSPFDSEHAAALERGIDGAWSVVSRRFEGTRLRRGGVHRLALASQASVKRDVSLITSIGTCGIVFLFLFFFRSIRVVLLSVAPVALAMGIAIASARLLFGQIHGLTFAFGAALIGVCVDYSVHLINLHAGSTDAPSATATRILPALALGAATTIIGLASFALAGFPGLAQIAMFATIGVASALLITRYVLPPWLPKVPIHPAARRTRILLARYFASWRTRKVLAGGLLVGLVVFSVVGLSNLRWVDDIRALDHRDPALAAKDRAIADLISDFDRGRFVVAVGNSLNDALEANDRAWIKLTHAQKSGDIDGLRSLHQLLFSEALQKRNYDAATARRAMIISATERALEKAGFVPDAFAPFLKAQNRPFNPVRYAALMKSPLKSWAQAFVIDLDTQGGSRKEKAVLTFVKGADAKQLATIFSQSDDIFVFDQATFLEKAYGDLRKSAVRMTLVGLVLVLALVAARYRDLRRTLSAFLPAVVSAGFSFAVVALSGHAVTILHLVALLLVLSIGVDYGVFMVEHHGRDLSATLLSTATACATTVLSFGLLGTSAHPALQAIGIVVGVGVACAFLLTPLIVALMLPDEDVSSATD